MIYSFNGEFRFLSNFWPVEVMFEGDLYSSVEAAYVAAKFIDKTMREMVRRCKTAGEAKRFGETWASQVRPDWYGINLGIMENLLRSKFENVELRQKLLETGDQELVEGNTWGDTFWGVCDGIGENNLGKLLMKIRSEL